MFYAEGLHILCARVAVRNQLEVEKENARHLGQTLLGVQVEFAVTVPPY